MTIYFELYMNKYTRMKLSKSETTQKILFHLNEITKNRFYIN